MKVYQGAEIRFREGDSHGIDCEVTPRKIIFKVARNNLWQLSWPLVFFASCGGNVDPKTIRSRHNCRLESMMTSQVPTDTTGKILGHAHTIPLNDNVQVNLIRAEHQIADRSTNKKSSSASCCGHLPAAMQPLPLLRVQFV
jgi:hypothetical protein